MGIYYPNYKDRIDLIWKERNYPCQGPDMTAEFLSTVTKFISFHFSCRPIYILQCILQAHVVRSVQHVSLRPVRLPSSAHSAVPGHQPRDCPTIEASSRSGETFFGRPDDGFIGGRRRWRRSRRRRWLSTFWRLARIESFRADVTWRIVFGFRICLPFHCLHHVPGKLTQRRSELFCKYFFMLLPAMVDLYFIRLMLLVIIINKLGSLALPGYAARPPKRTMCSGDPRTGHVQFSNGRPCPDFKWCSDFEWLSITIRKPDNLTIPYLPVTSHVLRFHFTLFCASRCLFSWKRNDWHRRDLSCRPFYADR